jgi:hypothetical protein
MARPLVSAAIGSRHHSETSTAQSASLRPKHRYYFIFSCPEQIKLHNNHWHHRSSGTLVPISGSTKPK